MINTEVIPFINITDIKYIKRTNIKNGVIILLTEINVPIHPDVSIIRLPLHFTGKHHEYIENIEKNKQILSQQLLTVLNTILEIHKNPNRENLYITCPDGLQVAPFVFLAYLIHFGKMDKQDALNCLLSKNSLFFKDGMLYYDILK